MGMWLQRGQKSSGVEEVQTQSHWLNLSENTMRFAVEGLFLWWKLGILILGQRLLWHFPNKRKVHYKCAFRLIKSGSEKSGTILIFNKARQRVCSHWSYSGSVGWVIITESLDISGATFGSVHSEKQRVLPLVPIREPFVVPGRIFFVLGSR